jgi:hypothetical protein
MTDTMTDTMTDSFLVKSERTRLQSISVQYRKYGKEADCRIEMFDIGHFELPEMRALILEWMDRYLVNGDNAATGD